ncbi:MAG: AAA family ATPase, partial [Oscillospiraceae bacterium]|nr:AAA family ATPase [Oscillospiraceae bacterium]
NGTGKSTIGRALSGEINEGIELEFTRSKTVNDFEVVKFNQKFIKDNCSNYNNWLGIFTFGEGNSKATTIIEEETEKIKIADKIINDKDIEILKLQAEQSDLKNPKIKTSPLALIWNLTDTVRDEFPKVIPSKIRKQADFVNAVISNQLNAEHEFSVLREEYKTAYDTDTIPYTDFQKITLSKSQNQNSIKLIDTPIINSSDTKFGQFIKQLNSTDWIRFGHDHFHTNGICPYCQQILPQNFENEIADCFDVSYQTALSQLIQFKKDYSEELGRITEILNFNLENNYPIDDRQLFQSKIENFKRRMQSNLDIIDLKINNPSIDDKSLEDIVAICGEINDMIEGYNQKIKNYNTVRNNPERKTNCYNKIWEYIGFLCSEAVKKYHSENSRISKVINSLEKDKMNAESDKTASKKEIAYQNTLIASVQPAVDGINDLLLKSGFKGFYLRTVKKSGQKAYQVIRQNEQVVGENGDNLSEGEHNFIAFLYFFFLVKGSHSDTDTKKPKIIVIDDPVSSMDSGVLSIVGTLTRELVDDCFCDGKNLNIKQLFILTHNPYFYKIVSNNRLSNEKDTYCKFSFFEVKKSEDNVSSIILCEQQKKQSDDYENFSPIQNHYSSLWNEYKDARLTTTLLSIMRRIIEYHLIETCSYTLETLCDKVTSELAKDKQKLKSVDNVLKRISDPMAELHEPGIISGLYLHSTASTEMQDYKVAFKEIFNVVGMSAHYAKMSGEEV